MGLITTAIGLNNKVKITHININDIMNEVKDIYNYYPTSLDILSRVFSVALMMSSNYKNNESLCIRIVSDGLIKEVLVESKKGYVRGYLNNPGVYFSDKNHKQVVNMAFGHGHMDVLKTINNNTYQSTVELISGNITDEFNHYFLQSEQKYTIVALRISYTQDYKVKFAGGFILEMLPGYSSDDVSIVEENIKKITNLELDCKKIFSILTDNDYKTLEEQRCFFRCDCSKEKYIKYLKDIKILDIDKQDSYEVTCNFCSKKYNITKEELEK